MLGAELASDSGDFALTDEQLAYFHTFGFLKFQKLFRSEIDELSAGFDSVFDRESPFRQTRYADDGSLEKMTIERFLDHDAGLRALRDDPRILGIASSLLGPQFEYAESDGNVFQRETSWHTDVYGASPSDVSIKMQLYLDPLDAATGALRVIPGSHRVDDEYAKSLRRHLKGSLHNPLRTQDVFGIEARDVPAFALSSEPGDLLVWNFRLYHASFGSKEPRRAMSLNFRRLPEQASPDHPGAERQSAVDGAPGPGAPRQ
jgi:hypothetical protein